MISKKNVLVISTIGSLIFFVWDYIGNSSLCNFLFAEGRLGSCPFTLASLEVLLIPFIPLLILSLITFKMREEVYHAWFRFARWWVPLSIVLIFISPEYSADQMFRIEKGSVALLTSVIFIIVSVILIVWKYFAMRGKN